MRRTPACLAAIALAAAGTTAAQAPNPAKLESELREALRQRWAALSRNDARAYGAFLDDAILVPDYGLLYDKKALIDRARNVKERSEEPREVHVHGDNHAAVMIYRTTSHQPFAGKELVAELAIVETYIKRDGRWLLTARAESEIPNAHRVAATIAPGILDSYIGEYEISPGNIVKITREGGKLMEQGPDDLVPEVDLPLSPDCFFQREQPGVLTFTRSPDGQVNAYVLWIFDTTIAARKIK